MCGGRPLRYFYVPADSRLTPTPPSAGGWWGVNGFPGPHVGVLGETTSLRSALRRQCLTAPSAPSVWWPGSRADPYRQRVSRITGTRLRADRCARRRRRTSHGKGGASRCREFWTFRSSKPSIMTPIRRGAAPAAGRAAANRRLAGVACLQFHAFRGNKSPGTVPTSCLDLFPRSLSGPPGGWLVERTGLASAEIFRRTRRLRSPPPHRREVACT